MRAWVFWAVATRAKLDNTSHPERRSVFLKDSLSPSEGPIGSFLELSLTDRHRNPMQARARRLMPDLSSVARPVYARSVRLERQVTELARHIAILEARRPPAPAEPESQRQQREPVAF